MERLTLDEMEARINEMANTIYKSGFVAAWTRSSSFIANPYNSYPDSPEHLSWGKGWIAGEGQRQVLRER